MDPSDPYTEEWQWLNVLHHDGSSGVNVPSGTPEARSRSQEPWRQFLCEILCILHVHVVQYSVVVHCIVSAVHVRLCGCVAALQLSGAQMFFALLWLRTCLLHL